MDMRTSLVYQQRCRCCDDRDAFSFINSAVTCVPCTLMLIRYFTVYHLYSSASVVIVVFFGFKFLRIFDKNGETNFIVDVD